MAGDSGWLLGLWALICGGGAPHRYAGRDKGRARATVLLPEVKWPGCRDPLRRDSLPWLSLHAFH